MTSTSSPSTFHRQDLFEGGTGGYRTCRIPVLTATPGGSLLAICEARKDWGDWSDIDILMRRSADGGKTWSESQIIADGGPLPTHNANLAVDALGRIHVFYIINYQSVFQATSTDDGVTFGAPRQITPTFQEFQSDYLFNIIGVGPGHGLVLRNGRIVLPVWLSNGGRRHRPSIVTSIVSDDHGGSWQRGELVPPLLPNMSETTAVELEDGSVLFNIRSEDRAHRRAICRSPDGATNWSKPVFDDALKEPVCMGQLLRLNFASPGTPGRVLFCNPDNDVYTGNFGQSWDNNKDRVNLTVKLSEDDCATWPVSRTLDPGISSYCDLAVLPDGTICVLYEREGFDNSMWVTRYVSLARFDLSWLRERAC